MPLESCAKDLLFWPLSNSKIINLYCLVESELRLSCDRICETPARMRASLLVTADVLHIALAAILHRLGCMLGALQRTAGSFGRSRRLWILDARALLRESFSLACPLAQKPQVWLRAQEWLRVASIFRFCCLHSVCRHQGAELRGRCETCRWLCWWRSLVFQSLTSFCSNIIGL